MASETVYVETFTLMNGEIFFAVRYPYVLYSDGGWVSRGWKRILFNNFAGACEDATGRAALLKAELSIAGFNDLHSKFS